MIRLLIGERDESGMISSPQFTQSFFGFCVPGFRSQPKGSTETVDMRKRLSKVAATYDTGWALDLEDADTQEMAITELEAQVRAANAASRGRKIRLNGDDMDGPGDLFYFTGDRHYRTEEDDDSGVSIVTFDEPPYIR